MLSRIFAMCNVQFVHTSDCMIVFVSGTVLPAIGNNTVEDKKLNNLRRNILGLVPGFLSLCFISRWVHGSNLVPTHATKI